MAVLGFLMGIWPYSYLVYFQNEQDALNVTQYQLSGWQDQGSILSVEDVTDVVYTVTELTASSTGPVTVHCR